MPTHNDRNRDRDNLFVSEALCWLPDVARYALSLTKHEPDSDDLVQETFLRAYRSWDSYSQGTECRAWLFTICRNQFYRTRERAMREVPSEDAELEALAAAHCMRPRLRADREMFLSRWISRRP
jgi:RNA polymerase sigma-70 factor (ECF subfamily)